MQFRLLPVLALLLAVIIAACGKGTGGSTSIVQSQNQYVVQGKTTVVGFPKAGVYATLSFDEYPVQILKTTQLFLQFWEMANGSPQTGPFIDPGFDLSHPNVKLWMVMPDGFAHGSRPLQPKKVVNNVGGVNQVTFQLQDAYFSMEGHWQVHLNLIKDGSLKDSAVVVYEVPAP